MYTINPKITIKVRKQRSLAHKPKKEKKQNHKNTQIIQKSEIEEKRSNNQQDKEKTNSEMVDLNIIILIIRKILQLKGSD